VGASAVWIIAAPREEWVAQYGPIFHLAVARHMARPEHQAVWHAWCENPDLEPGYFPDPRPGSPNQVAPHPPVVAFAALAGDMPWDDPEAPPIDLFSSHAYRDDVEHIALVVRKGSPVAALFHGIGPARAQLLPGWMGNFLLTPAEVRAAGTRVEEALTFNANEREPVMQRVRDWLNLMGDSGDEDAEEVVAGPLRCWRSAIESGTGLCANQSWAT